jgi:hypothetical protein
LEETEHLQQPAGLWWDIGVLSMQVSHEVQSVHAHPAAQASTMRMTMLKRLLLPAALIPWVAMPAGLLVSPAAWAQGCSVTLPGGTTKTFSLPCPLSQGNDAGIADRILAGRPQTARNLETSYNCFFYVQTNVLSRTPTGINFVTPENVSRGTLEWRHQVPGTDYFDGDFLTSLGYRFAATSTDLRSFSPLGPNYEPEPGDIVLVPGQDENLKMNEQFKHVAMIQGTRSGAIIRLRQKFDPFNRVIDLTPAEFLETYQPEAVGNIPAQYRVYHKPPYVGQIKVQTGTFRSQDGYLYATSQLINIIVYSFTPDGARLRGPLNSRNGGLYVAAEGIFHRTANGPLYQLLGLIDAQGRERQYNQTIQLYTCSGGTAC